jgi:AraC-like DNA-binding protein
MEMARTRGVRAARMHAIKSDLAANPALSLQSLAAQQNLTPRYIQKLFEAEGTTFTAYALEFRLGRAYEMLSARGLAGWTIGAIALCAGFGDVSHFNRSFRRRFGASPSDVRAEALRARGDVR